MPSLPPISNPEAVKFLWYQSVPGLDLTDIGRFRNLESLMVEDAKSIVGFSGLKNLAGLTSLTIGNVGSVDEPAALADLPLTSFGHWNERATDRLIWWMPDLRILLEKGVVEPGPWIEHREAFERRWSKRTGLPVPRYFS
ncbi:MAG: hypothetical protein QOD50_537 [Actinomycetota bacterium]|nr:hypothetical protein [Actinomycetota bacterium]